MNFQCTLLLLIILFVQIFGQSQIEHFVNSNGDVIFIEVDPIRRKDNDKVVLETDLTTNSENRSVLPLLNETTTESFTITTETKTSDVTTQTSSKSTEYQHTTIEIDFSIPPTEANYFCHNTCKSMMDNSVFMMNPNISYIDEGSSVTFGCSLDTNSSLMTTQLIWLFQSKLPPLPQCSMTSQDTLNLCESFDIIEDTDDQTDEHISSTIKLKHLKPENSGTYMCQIKVLCCPGHLDEHNMSHLIRKELIIGSLYKNELFILGMIVGGLLLILVIGNIIMYRRRQNKYIILLNQNKKINHINPKSILHIPILNDEDADSFTSDQEDFE